LKDAITNNIEIKNEKLQQEDEFSNKIIGYEKEIKNLMLALAQSDDKYEKLKSQSDE
jgi:hypothetical protein